MTKNSLLDSAWIAVQERVIPLTIRDQLSRIFDTEYGGTLSPMHKRLKFLGCTAGPLIDSLSIAHPCYYKTLFDQARVCKSKTRIIFVSIIYFTFINEQYYI